MHRMRSARGCDVGLLGYLQAVYEAEADVALNLLLSELAQPLVRDIVASRLRVGRSPPADINEHDFADLQGEIVLKLVARLRRLRVNPDQEPIENFRGYVAVTAYNACDGFLRVKYPRRHSLKNQLRYVLTHSTGLAIWENAAGARLCGFQAWRGRPHPIALASVQEALAGSPVLQHQSAIPGKALNPGSLLSAIFNELDGPVALDDLVSVVAEIQQIKDLPVPSAQMSNEEVVAVIASAPAAELDLRLDQRRHLEQIWLEIEGLPPRQRTALLMNLKDARGRSAVALLPPLRIASIRQIAEMLGIPAERFAALWNQLPLDDEAIAEQLSVTRQQVINLRKCARERLRRRTRKFQD